MKKLSSLIIALFVLTAGTAFGQTNVNVTAEVLAEITATGSDVSFGNVEQNSVAEVQANADDPTTSTNASNPVAGALTITAAAQDYSVSVTQPAVLSDGSATPNTLTFTHRVFHGANNVTTDTDGTGYVVTGGGNQTLDIGGQLQSATVAGSYSTASTGGQPLIFEVAYSSL